MSLEPNRDQIEIFVDALFRYASGTASLRSFYEEDSRPFQIVPIPLSSCGLVTLIDTAEEMARQAANHPEKIVFCPPIATFHNGRSAAEKDIAEGLVLTVELDANPDAARAKLEDILGPASVVVRSGGKWIDPTTNEQHDKLHLHWRLVKPAIDKADLARLKRARQLAARIVGADPSGMSIVYPFRWPGSWHRKAVPRLCDIEATDP